VWTTLSVDDPFTFSQYGFHFLDLNTNLLVTQAYNKMGTLSYTSDFQFSAVYDLKGHTEIPYLYASTVRDGTIDEKDSASEVLVQFQCGEDGSLSVRNTLHHSKLALAMRRWRNWGNLFVLPHFALFVWATTKGFTLYFLDHITFRVRRRDWTWKAAFPNTYESNTRSSMAFQGRYLVVPTHSGVMEALDVFSRRTFMYTCGWGRVLTNSTLCASIYVERCPEVWVIRVQ
jgi:hypothetical protein